MERNRVGEELAKWNKIQQGLMRNHPKDLELNRAFKLEKLSALEKITLRIKKGATPAERIDLRIIKETKKKLEKELYPNFYLRIARRAIVRFVMARSIADELNVKTPPKKRAENNKDLSVLNQSLDDAGLDELKKRIAEKIAHGLKDFSVTISKPLTERERVEYDIRVSLNKAGYALNGYQATLFHGGNNTGRSHFFKMENGKLHNLEAAGHLLAGRAIKMDVQRDGLDTKEWLQLNLNDRDVDGNYKLRAFSGDRPFDLENAIRNSLMDVKITPDILKGLASEMEKGRLANYLHPLDGKEEKIFLAANPSKKMVETYDSNGAKVNLKNKVEGKKIRVGKKQNLSPEQKKTAPKARLRP